MKDKIQALMKRFSGAIVQPVMFLAITGLVLAIGVVLQIDSMPAGLQAVGDFVYNLMMNGGINQLSVIFCVGITCALAKRKKVDAAILAISEFLFFLYANNAWLTSQNLLAEQTALGLYGTGQAVVLGVQVVDMGVFLGILLGCVNGWLFNKFCDVEFKDAVRIYGGSRFAYLICTAATVFLAIILCYVWPIINNGINACGTFIESSGNLGLFVYGFLNRFLIPTGMHHLIYMPFMFTPLGGTMQIGDTVLGGATLIWSGQLGIIDSITALDPSVKYMLFGFSKVFGCIGLTMAFIKTAKPERKAETRALLLPLLSVAVIAGITEPLEFMFMFAAPLLWLVHSVLDGLFQVIVFALGCRFPFSGGILSCITTFFTVPTSLTKWYILFIVGFIAIFVWYFAFVFLIKKFDYKTPGREESVGAVEGSVVAAVEGNSKEEKGKNGLGDVDDIIEGLGGKDNIMAVNNCFTRLRVDVKDMDKLDEAKINKFKNSGIVKKGNNVQIIIGMKVQSVREDVCAKLGIE